MREKWTDERLDDLRDHMDEGFAIHREALRDVRLEIAILRSETKADIAGLRTELKGDIASLDHRMRGEFAAVRSELGAMQRLMLRVGAGMVGTMALGFASILLTH